MKTSKQKTIGLNPLEHYLSLSSQGNSPEIKEPEQVIQQQVQEQQIIPVQYSEQEEAQIKKQRVTLHVPQELLDKVKNAVYWEPGLTLAGFAEYAFEQALEKLEQERGAPFPDRKTRKLRGGRPIK